MGGSQRWIGGAARAPHRLHTLVHVDQSRMEVLVVLPNAFGLRPQAHAGCAHRHMQGALTGTCRVRSQAHAVLTRTFPREPQIGGGIQVRLPDVLRQIFVTKHLAEFKPGPGRITARVYLPGSCERHPRKKSRTHMHARTHTRAHTLAWRLRAPPA